MSKLKEAKAMAAQLEADHPEEAAKFTYWKRPWYKWAILGLALYQAMDLWMNWNQYRTNLTQGLIPAAEWADYAVLQQFRCLMNGLFIVIFIGALVIGAVAKSKRQAKLGETVLLLLATVMGGVGLLLWPAAYKGVHLLCLGIFVIGLVGFVNTLFLYFKAKREEAV